MKSKWCKQTDYPWSGKVSITVNPKTSKRFTVRLRAPNRTTSALYAPSPRVDGILSLKVNGAAVKPVISKGYAAITRTWKAGDRIELELHLAPQRITPSDRIESTRGKIALRYGPLVYNIEQADQDITKPVSTSAPLETEWRADLLGGVTAIKSRFADGSPLLAVPNYARTNRTPGLPPEAGPMAADPSFYMGPGTKSPQALEAAAEQRKRRQRRPPVSVVWMKRG
jgi:hypothetical protein